MNVADVACFVFMFVGSYLFFGDPVQAMGLTMVAIAALLFWFMNS